MSDRGKHIVTLRHPEWLENQIRWRWLQDSYEGGERYRNATYGPDRRGLPARNLFRHKREYPDPQQFPNAYQGYVGFLGSVNANTTDVGYGPYPGQVGADPASTAADDNYELRRSRTPIPEFTSEAIDSHLSKIYDQEVKREGPDLLSAEETGWWLDVDGCGTPVDDWMRETVAPLLMCIGHIDLLFDHPRAPDGESVNTQADVIRLGLDRCVASVVLPENLVWWKLDGTNRRYRECLVREYVDPSERVDTNEKGGRINPDWTNNDAMQWQRQYCRYRHWTPIGSQLYSYDGQEIGPEVPHRYGRPPIVRLIDKKKHRTPHCGKSRYESVAEYQREYYNRDSELILSDTLQAAPLLSGPEEFCTSDAEISTGPDYVLPKKKSANGDSYEGWEFVSPPKDPAESIRQNKHDLIDLKDRAAGLTKPAGVKGTGRSTVAQSGVSKVMDAHEGNKLLTSIAKSLARAERDVCEYALLVLRDGKLDPAELKKLTVIYPSRFELTSLDDLCTGITELQAIVGAAGELPETEVLLLQAIIRQLLLGLDDEQYAELDEEIQTVIESKATLKEQRKEMVLGAQDREDVLAGQGDLEGGGGVDPTGQSAATTVSNVTPAVV